MLIEDYCLDLAELPAWAIARACNKYRRDSKSDFFPRPGKILKLANDAVSAYRNDVLLLKRLANQVQSLGDGGHNAGGC